MLFRSIATRKDGNSPAWMRRDATANYESALRDLEEAHKISLLDVIKDSEDETQ